MTLLVGAWTAGLVLSLVALGVLVSYRIFRFPDITVDGSFTFGATVAAALLVRGTHPAWASLAGFGAGAAAGLVTGVLHTRFRIQALLAGILVMTALYSVNLRVLGRANVPLLGETTTIGTLLGATGDLDVAGWSVPARDAAFLGAALVLAAGVALLLYLFLRTELGTAMRATGDNPGMVRALGGDVRDLTTAGLALSNGLIGLAGAVFAQYQGFADVMMGTGILVWGLASLIIGEAVVGSARLGLVVTGSVVGSILFRLLVAIALRAGLDPNDLKLVTAGFVLAALVLTGWLARPKGGADAHA